MASSSQRVRVPTPPSVTGLDQAAPDVDSVRKIRDEIDARVQKLVAELAPPD